MARGTGAVIGSAAGAAVGSVVPGVGPTIGSAAGQILGNTIDQIAAGRKRESANPILEDPEQRALLEELRAKRRAAELGMDVTTQANLNEVGQTGEAVRDTITRVTGGNAGQSIDALLRSQKMENQGANQVLAASAQRIPYLMSLEDQMQDRISQRVLDLQMFSRAEKAAQEAQFRKENVMNLSAGIMSGRLTGKAGDENLEMTQSFNPEQTGQYVKELFANIPRRTRTSTVVDDSGIEPAGAFE